MDDEAVCSGNYTGSVFPTGLPLLPKCIQSTSLVWIPIVFTILMTPVFLLQAKRLSRRFEELPFSFLLILKMIISIGLTGINLLVFIYNVSKVDYAPEYVTPAFITISFGAMSFGHFVRKRSGMVTSGIQHLSAVIFLLAGAPEFYERITQGRETDREPHSRQTPLLYIAYLHYYGFLMFYIILLCFADPRTVAEDGEKKKSSPELDSSFFNRLTLWWFNPITYTGAAKDLEVEDLYNINPGSSTHVLIKLWEKHWTSENEWVSIKTLFSMFKWEFMTASFLKLLSDLLQFSNPFLLHQMIKFVSQEESNIFLGLSYAALMFGFSQTRSFVLNYYFYLMMRMGAKFQTTLTAAVYRKTLSLSNSARREKTVGEIINLMSIDTERFYVVTAQIQQFWSIPLQITMALVYLYYTLGASAFIGMIIMALFIPLNLFSSVLVKDWQIEQMNLKDERSKMVNEVLNGIKVVKLYAWEIPMQEHIEEIRKKELALIKKSALVRNIIDSFNATSPFLVALFTFSTYVLSDSENLLTPQVAFVALTLFNQLRANMSTLAFLINLTVQTYVSDKRLKAFFTSDELDLLMVDRDAGGNSELSAKIENCDAVWDQEEEKRTLKDISMTVRKGELLAVVGRVGSGKSSLLSALLGEMEKLKGRIGISGKLAYVPQQAWIQNMTVRDNILFGKPYDKEFYDKVLYSCALVADLKILPHGDMTEIGEKGINLSGGQKARISLARAVYQNYDVYLLDDPLSAVDAHVGKHIFEKVIGPNGLLKDKTRILVTHGLTYVKQADLIIVLEGGKIIQSGTYNDLIHAKGKFYKFLVDYYSTDNEAPKNDEDLLEIVLNSNKNEVQATRADSLLGRSSSSKEVDQKLIKKEAVGSGRVKAAVYRMYIKAASYWRCGLFFLSQMFFLSCQVGRSFWLSKWSNSYTNVTNSSEIQEGYYIGGYAILGTFEASSLMMSFIISVFAGLQASKNLHGPLIHSILRSPMEFFDTTPLGRILNRCTKDIETVDFALSANFRMVVAALLQVLFTLAAIVLATPLFVIVIIPLAILYCFVLKYFVATSRQLTRLENTNRSPIFSHFGETVQGASSIRAFDKVEEFRANAGFIVDNYVRCKYLTIVSTRWLAVRLEFIGNLVIFFAALFAVMAKELGYIESPGIVGVSISYALSITDVLNMAVRNISNMESSVVSVERIEEYAATPNEAEWEILGQKQGKEWPEEGRLEFRDYSTRYRAGLDLVLKNISVKIEPGEKIGIVGRTGAGKSSLTQALFRLIEPASGQILIDGVDVSEIGLHDLRSALTIIPQDPVLFSGTLRFNLDPFNRRQDSEIWQALELAHLREIFVQSGLSHRISEGGENISVGQRQLVCLARALLRQTRILVLDEATAAVDVATDALIQATIRQQFTHSTVFTIAHRLNTILDYDRILVLDQGHIAEFDSPANLLDDRETIFSKMVADSKNQEAS